MNHYYQNSKEYINEKVTCDICGCQYARMNLLRQQRSNKCKSHTKPIENDM